ncbi:MAG: hypothetical protein ACI841_001777 [Planctomycetota bacterium]|jgi:hypothetical protein
MGASDGLVRECLPALELVRSRPSSRCILIFEAVTVFCRTGQAFLLQCFALFAIGQFAWASGYSASTEHGIRVGHWIEAKGALGADGNFHVEAVQVATAAEEEQLIGTVTRVAGDGSWFELLGQRVICSDKTRWRNIDATGLNGARIKVLGYYRGPTKFSARSISRRGSGRDALIGRVDALRQTAEGFEVDVMRFMLLVTPEVDIESEHPLEEYELIDARAPIRSSITKAEGDTRARDDDDYIPGQIQISDSLSIGFLFEARTTDEHEFDLRKSEARNRADHEASVRAEVTWRPSSDFHVVGGVRQMVRWRDDERDGQDELTRLPLVELYAYWSDVFGLPFDLQVGRQDFDEDREWLWDKNLDAVRGIVKHGDLRLELAAATTLHDGGERAEATDTFLAYIYHEVDDCLLGAYVIDTRTRLEEDDFPIHMGVRAIGNWLPQQEVWAEAAVVQGYHEQTDIRGWGLDVGTTWSPDLAEPWYFSAGFSFGSGDDDSTDSVDHAFRQTGLQDNNDKLGGVTSFKYYGELLEPELSNLEILTLGVGCRPTNDTSIDLVYHRYRQDQESDRIRGSHLDRHPNGISDKVGSELDLILGHRFGTGADLEVVFGVFDPSDAFDDDELATLAKLQYRMRF